MKNKIEKQKVRVLISGAMPARRIPGQKEIQVKTKMVLQEAKAKIMQDARNLLQNDQEKPGPWLYKFRDWFFIENKEYVKLDESGVPDKLKQYPQMSTTIFVIPKSAHVLPDVLKGRRGVVFIEESSEENISLFILKETGCSISVQELGGLNL
jgi:hypothetical protein